MKGEVKKIEKQIPITELLRKTRRKKGYSISRVVADLNINEEFIRALEDGQLGKLPPQSYTLGFVKAYAKYLDISPHDAVETFKRTYDLQTESFLGAPSEEEKKDLPLNEKINIGLSSFYNSRGTIVFGIVVLSLFLGYRILLSKPRSTAPVFYETEEDAPQKKKEK
jgi:cytoskeletal protein RodZ